jgi:hypothetical protein
MRRFGDAGLAACQPAFFQYAEDGSDERGIAVHFPAQVPQGHWLSQFEQGPGAEPGQAVVLCDLAGYGCLPGRQFGHDVEDLRVETIRAVVRHNAAAPP